MQAVAGFTAAFARAMWSRFSQAKTRRQSLCIDGAPTIATFLQTTLIEWNGDSRQLGQWFQSQQTFSKECSLFWLRPLSVAAAAVVEPLPWDGAAARRCHQNVSAVIAAKGGSFAFGWALSYQGPRVISHRQITALYGRWVNHVVWRDPSGVLREVTPHVDPVNSGAVGWMKTIFALDEDATFEGAETRPPRYLPLGEEGYAVAEYLNRAQHSDSDQMRLHWLRMAMAAIEPHGFTPKACRVESIGQRTSNIVILAE